VICTRNGRRNLRKRKLGSKRKKNINKDEGGNNCLYTLDVFIISGQMTEKFIKENPVISRTIQIRGDQTLEQLHKAVFDAFAREEEHMYEFQFGEGPMDPKGKRYVLPMALTEPVSKLQKPAGDITSTAIKALDLKIDQAFGYWFDFGDDWWHQINVVSIGNTVSKGKYPKLTKHVGENPPQYIDWDNKQK